MGLLDMFSTPDARGALAMLAAAGPSAQPLSFGQRMTGLLQQMDQQRAAEEDRKARQQMQALQMGLLGAQIDETKAQAGARQAAAQEAARKAAEAQRVQSLLASSFMPVSGTQANAASGVAGPRPEAAAAIGQRPAVDYQALMAQGVPAELVKAIAEARNYGRDKVARTLEVAGQNGAPETVMVDDYGNRVGGAMPKPVELRMQDTGGSIVALNPYTMQLGGKLGKTNTPDALLSAATARRAQDIADARARESNQIQRDSVGKVEWKQDVNGAWIALPKEVSGSGPVVPVTTTAPGKREQQAQNALDIIDAAEKLIDKGTSSYVGAGVDQAARLFGASTPGSEAAAQLKALEGALMMAQPRMEGPQSNQDVALYRQMAAQIGDSTAPAGAKRAALKTIRELHSRYAGGAQQQPAQPAGRSLSDLLNKYGN